MPFDHVEMQEIITRQPLNSLVLFTDEADRLDILVEDISIKARSLVPDITTTKGREAIRTNAANVTKAKTAIEKAGKTLADEQKKIPKVIDATRKKTKEALEALHLEVRKPLTLWEETQAQIKHDIELKVTSLRNLLDDVRNTPGVPAQYVLTQIELAEATVIDETWGDKEELSAREKILVLSGLKTIHIEKVKAEADAVELETLRAEAEQSRVAERKKIDAKIEKDRKDAAKVKDINKRFDIFTASRNLGNLSLSGLENLMESTQDMEITEADWAHKYSDVITYRRRFVSELREQIDLRKTLPISDNKPEPSIPLDTPTADDVQDDSEGNTVDQVITAAKIQKALIETCLINVDQAGLVYKAISEGRIPNVKLYS